MRGGVAGADPKGLETPGLGGGLGPGIRFTRDGAAGAAGPGGRQGGAAHSGPFPELGRGGAGAAAPRGSGLCDEQLPDPGDRGGRGPTGPWATLRGAGTRGGPRPRLQGARCPAGSVLGRSPRIPVALGAPATNSGSSPGRVGRGCGGEDADGASVLVDFPAGPGRTHSQGVGEGPGSRIVGGFFFIARDCEEYGPKEENGRLGQREKETPRR